MGGENAIPSHRLEFVRELRSFLGHHRGHPSRMRTANGKVFQVQFGLNVFFLTVLFKQSNMG